MNNTTTSIVAIFMAATLVVGIGTFAVTTTQSAYAYQKKGGGEDNGKGNGNGNTVTIEECQNRGSASGFDTALDQECQNLICTHPGENATCTQEGVTSAPSTPTPPVKLTCEQCFIKFLSSTQISGLLAFVRVSTLEQFCTQILPAASAAGLAGFLVRIGLSESEAAQLIQCLIDAGVQFSTDTGTIRTR
jgi:hypothetical protein